MLSNYHKALYFPHLKRVKQSNVYYCGPAVLEMLLSHLGVNTTQDDLVRAAGIENRIANWGMLVSDMGLAVARLFPDLCLWLKDGAMISELRQLVEGFNYPVGVEWQGTFAELPDEEIAAHYGSDEDEDDDTGHYGVVTHVDTQGNAVFLLDPFGPYAGLERRFSVLEFEKRWWDINVIFDPVTGRRKHVHDYHLMFIVTPRSVDFPERLGMVRG